MSRRTVAALAVAVGFAAAGCGSSAASGADEHTFVGRIAQNAKATAADTGALLAEIAANAGVDQVGADAQALHDHLDGFYNQIITDSAMGDDRETAVAAAVGELRDAAGAIATWTQHPSAAGAQAAADQLQPAVADWNTSAAALWKAAKAGSAPLIPAP